ncbi:MAG: alpha-glucosidase C-terminal domain-containing protein [Melioribacteraceae bacterium]|nr:alpha-glucosidase C-terminal domain-containing protein [Melioribacteraceae bacterium]
MILVSLFLLISCTKEVTNKNTPSPEWVKSAVFYQIFPERFNNGDKNNDPELKDMENCWPYKYSADWKIHPWTSDWYKLQPWEVSRGGDFYNNFGIRRYGGDLQGVIDKLDYLSDLGITAIYFNPLFESPSLHKYDASSYHHIDDNFGPDPDGDKKLVASETPGNPLTWEWTSADKMFLTVIEECHKRNIKVIIDGVFNHTGNNFWAFKDVIKNGESSKYKEWYNVKKYDDPATEENEFDYDGWNGVHDLPEIKEDENGLVADFAEHVHAISKRWMDPNNDGDPGDGIDGWRLDVAEMVNIEYWKLFRRQVKEINPDAYITGEIWWEQWNENKMFNAAPWLKGDAFDGIMNYRYAAATKNFIIDNKNKISAEEFVNRFKQIYSDYKPDAYYFVQNLNCSHDVDRLASQIINPDIWYDHTANPQQNKNYDVRKPNAEERAKQKLIIGIQMTLPGAPVIYYGDEAGMWGGDDPDCRKPMVWSEFDYETETTHPMNLKRPADEVKFDEELFNYYKKIIGIRNNNEVLSKGKINFLFTDNENDIVVYERVLDDERILVVINNNSEKVKVDLSKYTNGLTKDLITDGELKIIDSIIELDAYQILVLK